MTETAADPGREVRHRSDPRLERLEEWFVADYEPLMRFAYLLTGNMTAAEDLVQEAFVRLHRHWRRIEAEGFRSYARKTIVNLQRSALRRRRIERLALETRRVEPASEPLVLPFVWETILKLPRQQRACIVLRFYEQMTDVEIANALEVRPGTVKKAMHRAMTALRSQLGDEG